MHHNPNNTHHVNPGNMHLPLLLTLSNMSSSILGRTDMDWSNGKLLSCNSATGDGIFRFGKPETISAKPNDFNINVSRICGEWKEVDELLHGNLNHFNETVIIIPNGTFNGYAPTQKGERVEVSGLWRIAQEEDVGKDGEMKKNEAILDLEVPERFVV